MTTFASPEQSPEPASNLSDISSALAESRVRTEDAWGTEFARIVSALPAELRDLRSFFRALPPVRDAEQLRFNQSYPDVRSAGEPGLELAAYGLRPVSIRLAASGLAMLVERMIDLSIIPPVLPVRLPVERGGASDPVTPEMVIGEIGRMARTDTTGSELIARWMHGAIEHCPTFIPRFSARSEKGAIMLVEAQDPAILKPLG